MPPYTLSVIQNQILEIRGDSVLCKILQKVENAKYYNVIADEVTECSNKEQLSIVLRYFNVIDNQIREDFVAFIDCDCGVTGNATATTFLTSHGLDISKFRGQAYDGTGGSLRGTAALIKKEYPLALYLHC